MEECYTLELKYEGNTILIQCNINEKMEDVISRFSSKVGVEKENLVFLYKKGINIERSNR